MTSHPIQYHAPWFRALAQRCTLQVYFAHRQSAAEQGAAGYGVDFDWDVQHAGTEVMDAHGGNPLPDETLQSIRDNGVALKGPITTPVGGGFRSVNVGLRKSLDMYAQVRPCKTYPGVRTRFEDVDLIIIRENTEDLYAGIEY